jgi:hypothetical protein
VTAIDVAAQRTIVRPPTFVGNEGSVNPYAGHGTDASHPVIPLRQLRVVGTSRLEAD